MARGLAREKAIVVVHGRDRLKAEQVARDIVADGGRAHAVVGDLTLDADVERLVAEAEALVGPINILVNNAGGSGGAEDWSTTRAATWAAAFDRNVLAAVRVTSLLLPDMRAAKWGRVINISSLAGMIPPATRPDYLGGEGGNERDDRLHGQGRGARRRHRQHGLTRHHPQHQPRNRISNGRAGQRHGRGCALGRDRADGAADVCRALGRVETLDEIADAIAFLASPRAGYITGSNLRLDGGMLPTV